MFKALTDLIDSLFKPVNAFFSKLTGSGLPAQGGNVLDRSLGVAALGLGGVTGRLVDRLPQFVIDGAPTSLTPLQIPLSQLSVPTGPAQLPPALDESEKPSWAEVREV